MISLARIPSDALQRSMKTSVQNTPVSTEKMHDVGVPLRQETDVFSICDEIMIMVRWIERKDRHSGLHAQLLKQWLAGITVCLRHYSHLCRIRSVTSFFLAGVPGQVTP